MVPFFFAGSAKNPGVRSANSRHPGEGTGAAAEDGGAQRIAGEQRDDRQADTDFGEQTRQGERLTGQGDRSRLRQSQPRGDLSGKT